MGEKTPEVPQYATQGDIRWMQQQIDRLERGFRILIDLMIAKKVIDEPTAKIFSETKINSDELIEWYIKELKEKESTK